MSTASWCSIAGGRTGTPGTTISICRWSPARPPTSASNGSRTAAIIALLHNDPRPEADRHSLGFASEAGRGDRLLFRRRRQHGRSDRRLSRADRPAPMLPRWAYGFWQSRQRYETQDQLLGVRRANIAAASCRSTISCRTGSTGPRTTGAATSSTPRATRTRRAMIDQVHAQNAHIMISVWPKFYPTDRQLQASSPRWAALYLRNLEAGARTGSGPAISTPSTIPTIRRARDIYWRQIRDRLASLGIDAWWLDAERARHPFEPVDRGAERGGWARPRSGPGARLLQLLSR